VTWVMWNLVLVRLKIVLVPVQDSCTVCLEIVLVFVQDWCTVCADIGSETVLEAYDGTAR
jgi:hypothetical protein